MAIITTQKVIEVDGSDTLKKIELSLSRLGDLPIFSATLNKVRNVSSDTDSDAMTLAMEVMKDANLTAKILQLANSPVYNRGLGKITIISRAVILLGFETIRSLCLTLKLIESFNTSSHGFDMNGMLVNAFLTAGMARQVAEKAGVQDIEQSYICGLLHGLGEIIVAYALPEKYQEMLQQCEKTELNWKKIQQKQLGITFHEVGHKLAEQWGFAGNVIKTMKDYKKSSDRSLHDSAEINRALASLSNASLDVIYAKQNRDKQGLGEIYQDMADAVGIHRCDIEECMQQSFRNSCELASDYGIDMKLLMPPVQESKDALLNKTARQLSFFASTRNQQDDSVKIKKIKIKDDANKKPDNEISDVKKRILEAKKLIKNKRASSKQAVNKKNDLVKKDKVNINLQQQLMILQEITALISSSAGTHHVFAKVLEGMQKGLGYKRAILSLLSSDHSHIQVRLGVGERQDKLKQYFNLPVRDKNNMFIKVLREGNELFVDDVNSRQWKNTIPEEFIKQVGASSFMIAALRAGERIVGLFYADMDSSNILISDELQQGFLQFVSQARLALQYAEMQGVK